jgi:aryl-alcohol dehydrogenase-like predicted oxidoreductase
LIPILGSRAQQQLTDTLAALHLDLNDGQIKRLENASTIDYGTPHQQIAGALLRAQGAGAEYISIRPPRA